MADFYQTGVVATLHRLGVAKVEQLERDLERFTVATDSSRHSVGEAFRWWREAGTTTRWVTSIKVVP